MNKETKTKIIREESEKLNFEAESEHWLEDLLRLAKLNQLF